MRFNFLQWNGKKYFYLSSNEFSEERSYHKSFDKAQMSRSLYCTTLTLLTKIFSSASVLFISSQFLFIYIVAKRQVLFACYQRKFAIRPLTQRLYRRHLNTQRDFRTFWKSKCREIEITNIQPRSLIFQNLLSQLDTLPTEILHSAERETRLHRRDKMRQGKLAMSEQNLFKMLEQQLRNHFTNPSKPKKSRKSKMKILSKFAMATPKPRVGK